MLLASSHPKRKKMEVCDQPTVPLRLKMWVLAVEVVDTAVRVCDVESERGPLTRVLQVQCRFLPRFIGWKETGRDDYATYFGSRSLGE